MKHSKKMSAIILSLLMAVSLTACGGGNEAAPQGSASGQGAYADDLRIIRMTQSSGYQMDPGTGIDFASSILSVNLYDALVYPELDGRLSPGLAEEGWSVSEDGLTWIFPLKQGVQFHDGTEMKASDVVFSAERMLTMGEGYAYLFSEYLDTVEALDEYTVQFNLKKSFAPFLTILPRMFILNESLVMSNLTDGPFGEYGDYGRAFLAENDAGSGAYACEEMRVQDRVVMKKFDGYHGGFADNAPEVVEIISGTETATVRTLMANRELEISDQWQTNESYEALNIIEGVTLGSFSNGNMFYLMLNTDKAPTDDVHVRKALAHLIDYAQVTEILFPGYRIAESPVPDSIPGFAQNLTTYEYSLEKAREELALSVYADQLDSLSIEVAWIADVPDEEKLAILLQASAQQIGLNIDVTKVPWGTHVDNVANVDTTPNAVTCFVAADYDEAGALLYQRFHSDTAGTWQQIEWLLDESLDSQINTALTTLNDTERYAIYGQIQQEAMENVYGINIAEQAERHAYYDYIVWPAMERAKTGESVAATMGYGFLFRTFQVNK